MMIECTSSRFIPFSSSEERSVSFYCQKYCLALLEFQTQSINVHFEVMYSRKFIYMLPIKKDLVCIQVCRRSRRNEEHVFI